MSATHLTTGSVEPPRVPNILRLYSTLICPFAQRARLVLKAKGIPHDIVNINLTNKPEWYLKLNPQGKVPALLDGDKIIIESLDISTYLDEKYPQNPLQSSDPATREKDKELIKSIDSFVTVFNQSVFTKTDKTLDDWIKEFVKVLQPLEDELVKRGTTFFGGEKPGLFDYMLWPWGERLPIIALKYQQKPELPDDLLPNLRKWRKAFKEDPVAKELYLGPEKFWKFVTARLSGQSVDYDVV